MKIEIYRKKYIPGKCIIEDSPERTIEDITSINTTKNGINYIQEWNNKIFASAITFDHYNYYYSIKQ